MRAIGIKVGQLNIDNYPEYARTYNTEKIPTLLLFRPNKEPLLYNRDRTAKAMGNFITENQLGEKHVTLIEKSKHTKTFFNSSSRVPRVLVLSQRSYIPPVFKQICFKHRKGVVCGFVSEQHDTFDEVKEKLGALAGPDVNLEDLELPAVFTINPRGTPVVSKFTERVNFENMNEFVQKVSLAKPKEDPEVKKEQERKKKAEERKVKRAEEKKAREEAAAKKGKPTSKKGKSKHISDEEDEEEEDDEL
jgi:flagellar biosynthesis GTPase FlhF